MPKLSPLQTDLLTASAHDLGAIASPEQGRTAASLIKAGLAMSIPQTEGPSRLMITSAGRGVLGVGPAPGPAEQTVHDHVPPLPEGAQEAAGVEPPPPEAAGGSPGPKGKLGVLVGLLRRPEGAAIGQLTAATGWQAHSVRGAIAGAVKKKLHLAVISEKTEAGRVYRIVPGVAA